MLQLSNAFWFTFERYLQTGSVKLMTERKGGETWKKLQACHLHTSRSRCGWTPPDTDPEQELCARGGRCAGPTRRGMIKENRSVQNSVSSLMGKSSRTTFPPLPGISALKSVRSRWNSMLLSPCKAPLVSSNPRGDRSSLHSTRLILLLQLAGDL